MHNDIVLPDSDDLTPEEKRRLKVLQELSPEDYDEEVLAYVEEPTESDQVVFRHPEVVALTYDSLNRLIGELQAERKGLKGRRRGHRNVPVIDEEISQLGRERKIIKPFYHLALAESGRKSPRSRALMTVAELRYPELSRDVKFAQNLYKLGASEPEVKEQLRRRWKEAG